MFVSTSAARCRTRFHTPPSSMSTRARHIFAPGCSLFARSTRRSKSFASRAFALPSFLSPLDAPIPPPCCAGCCLCSNSFPRLNWAAVLRASQNSECAFKNTAFEITSDVVDRGVIRSRFSREVLSITQAYEHKLPRVVVDACISGGPM